jgi:hypothetical protein
MECWSMGVLLECWTRYSSTPLLQRFVVEAKPEQFIDMRFLDILEKSVLLKELYP